MVLLVGLAECDALMRGNEYLSVDELIAEATRRPAWHAQAACRGQGFRRFFIEPGESLVAARKLCASCPVRVDCASAALADSSTLGVWGGSSPKQRDRARAEGWDAARLLAEVDAGTARDASPSAWQTEPCARCGGLLSRRDLALADGLCWGCR